jgi:hypothetical protein
MPIEIKEVHIKAVIQEETPRLDANSSAASATTRQMNTIVAQCVEQVLNILKEKQER